VLVASPSGPPERGTGHQGRRLATASPLVKGLPDSTISGWNAGFGAWFSILLGYLSLVAAGERMPCQQRRV
jgi:hypothetical protein